MWAKGAGWCWLLNNHDQNGEGCVRGSASTETIRLIRDGEDAGMGGGDISTLHCHHQNDSCVEMGSDESYFNVPLIVRDKVTRQCPQVTTFLKRKEGRRGIEPRSFCLPA